jgi:two-component system chemotaxis response regulator CheB
VKTVRVAVVDDSTFIRKAITRMLEGDTQIELVGSAGSGEELLTHLDRWRPDVVTLDLDMPGIGGLATLDRIMVQRPTAVIILSTHSGEGAPLTIEALHRGATDFIDKQRYSLVDFEALRGVLLEKIFEVTGVERADDTVGEESEYHPPAVAAKVEPISITIPGAYDLVVLGASTGGPPTLQTILEVLGEKLSVPIVVVQHMPVGFTQAFAERLNAYLPIRVREVVGPERLMADTVYIGASGRHIRIRRDDAELRAEISAEPADVAHIPSIDVLFESAARSVGRRAIGVLLTGMGSDGAQGMASLKQRGAYTLAQDEESCIVYWIPRAALALNAVTQMSDPEGIGKRLGVLIATPIS